MSDVIVRKPGRPKRVLEGNLETGEIDVVENADTGVRRGAHSFISMCREGGGYRVLEIVVDLDRGVVLSEVDHEPAMKAIAEDTFKIAVVKKVWSKVD
jgi:hypothetical protein